MKMERHKHVNIPSSQNSHLESAPSRPTHQRQRSVTFCPVMQVHHYFSSESVYLPPEAAGFINSNRISHEQTMFSNSPESVSSSGDDDDDDEDEV